FRFPNGNTETGKFELVEAKLKDDSAQEEEKRPTVWTWTRDAPLRVAPDAAPPRVVRPPPLHGRHLGPTCRRVQVEADAVTRARRAIARCIVKADHFEGIHRLAKEAAVAGVP